MLSMVASLLSLCHRMFSVVKNVEILFEAGTANCREIKAFISYYLFSDQKSIGLCFRGLKSIGENDSTVKSV